MSIEVKSVELVLRLMAMKVNTARLGPASDCPRTDPDHVRRFHDRPALRDASDFRQWCLELATIAQGCTEIEEFLSRIQKEY